MTWQKDSNRLSRWIAPQNNTPRFRKPETPHPSLVQSAEVSGKQALARDLMAQCPGCKTVETLQFLGDRLVTCRRFTQTDGRVYHDCGSTQPCRLHP